MQQRARAPVSALEASVDYFSRSPSLPLSFPPSSPTPRWKPTPRQRRARATWSARSFRRRRRECPRVPSPSTRPPRSECPSGWRTTCSAGGMGDTVRSHVKVLGRCAGYIAFLHMGWRLTGAWPVGWVLPSRNSAHPHFEGGLKVLGRWAGWTATYICGSWWARGKERRINRKSVQETHAVESTVMQHEVSRQASESDLLQSLSSASPLLLPSYFSAPLPSSLCLPTATTQVPSWQCRHI